jgi:hypothetical protein
VIILTINLPDTQNLGKLIFNIYSIKIEILQSQSCILRDPTENRSRAMQSIKKDSDVGGNTLRLAKSRDSGDIQHAIPRADLSSC